MTSIVNTVKAFHEARSGQLPDLGFKVMLVERERELLELGARCGVGSRARREHGSDGRLDVEQ